jgi:hypothetical protein
LALPDSVWPIARSRPPGSGESGERGPDRLRGDGPYRNRERDLVEGSLRDHVARIGALDSARRQRHTELAQRDDFAADERLGDRRARADDDGEGLHCALRASRQPRTLGEAVPSTRAFSSPSISTRRSSKGAAPARFVPGRVVVAFS